MSAAKRGKEPLLILGAESSLLLRGRGNVTWGISKEHRMGGEKRLLKGGGGRALDR